MNHSRRKRVFVKSDGGCCVVKMFVAFMAKALKIDGFRLQKRRAFGAERFTSRKDARFEPAFSARDAVRGSFDRFGADVADLRISESKKGIVDFLKHKKSEKAEKSKSEKVMFVF